jgi:hypothetical protein
MNMNVMVFISNQCDEIITQQLLDCYNYSVDNNINAYDFITESNTNFELLANSIILVSSYKFITKYENLLYNNNISVITADKNEQNITIQEFIKNFYVNNNEHNTRKRTRMNDNNFTLPSKKFKS